MTPHLLPIFALFIRAVRDDVRSRFPTIFRTLLLFMLFGLLVITHSRIDTLPSAGNSLLQNVAYLNLFGLTILGLATFASAITEEKEDETLDLLRLTRLNPLAILLGKSTARFTGGLLLLAVQIPFALLCVPYGGVRSTQVLEVYAILCAYLFFLCNLGLFISVLSRTTTVAVTMTTLSCVMLFVAPVLLSIFSSRISVGFDRLIFSWLYINPFADLVRVIMARGLPFAVRSVPVLLSGGVACFIAAWLVFNRFTSRHPVAMPRPKSPTRRRALVSRPWRYPLAWKDFFLSAQSPRKIILRQLLYLAAVFLYIAFDRRSSHPFRAFGRAAEFCGAAGLGLEIVLAAAAIFGEERRQQTLGTLWILPIPTYRLIWQKVAGHALCLLPAAFLLVAGVLLKQWAGPLVTYNSVISARRFAIIVNSSVQFVFFGMLITYLSLFLRRGAIVCGLLACVLGNYFFNSLLDENWSLLRRGSRYANDETAVYWIVTFSLVVLSFFLAVLIPRRLAACAAED